VYTAKTQDIEDKDTTIQILGVDEHFGCRQLKLYAKWVLAGRFLEASNAAKMMFVADEYSLSLLKEAAMNLYKTTPNARRKSESRTAVEESHRRLWKLLGYHSFQNLISSTSKFGN